MILHVYGNNDYALNTAATHFALHQFNSYLLFPITVAAGQTVSIMNVDILYAQAGRNSDSDGTLYGQDVARALAAGPLFVNSPVFDGLTVDQIATLINWNVPTGGELPAAGAPTAVSFGLQDAFDGMLRRKALLLDAKGLAANGTDSTKATAAALDSKGGKVVLSDNGETTSYLFGGLLSGNQSFDEGKLGFDGSVMGIGLERSLDSGLVGGLALGRSQGNGAINGTYSSVGSQNVTLSSYAKWNAAGGVQVFGSLFLANESFSYARDAGAETAHARFGGLGLGGKLEASKTFGADGTGLAVYAGVSYGHIAVDGYTETGAGNGNLDVASFGVGRTDVYAGLRDNVKFSMADGAVLRGFVGAGLGRSLTGDSSVATNYVGSTLGGHSLIDNGQGNYALIEVGLTGQLSQNTSIDVTYGQRFGQSTSDGSASVSMVTKF